jgi:hypothetical protein
MWDALAEIIGRLQWLIGLVVGSLLTFQVSRREFRRQQLAELIKDTAKALGMFFEDATNPERQAEKKKQLEAGQAVRSYPMRTDTSTALAAQTLLVAGYFGAELSDEMRTVTSGFDPAQDPTGNKFVEKAGQFLKKLGDQS